MHTTVDVTIPVEREATKALDSAARREAVGRYVSGLLKGGRVRNVLAAAIADAISTPSLRFGGQSANSLPGWVLLCAVIEPNRRLLSQAVEDI